MTLQTISEFLNCELEVSPDGFLCGPGFVSMMEADYLDAMALKIALNVNPITVARYPMGVGFVEFGDNRFLVDKFGVMEMLKVVGRGDENSPWPSFDH